MSARINFSSIESLVGAKENKSDKLNPSQTSNEPVLKKAKLSKNQKFPENLSTKPPKLTANASDEKATASLAASTSATTVIAHSGHKSILSGGHHYLKHQSSSAKRSSKPSADQRSSASGDLASSQTGHAVDAPKPQTVAVPQTSPSHIKSEGLSLELQKLEALAAAPDKAAATMSSPSVDVVKTEPPSGHKVDSPSMTSQLGATPPQQFSWPGLDFMGGGSAAGLGAAGNASVNPFLMPSSLYFSPAAAANAQMMEALMKASAAGQAQSSSLLMHSPAHWPPGLAEAYRQSAIYSSRFLPNGESLSTPNFLLQPFRKPKRIRTAFSPQQLMQLERAFDGNHYVIGNERKQLANRLNLSETQVKVWFQNRRTKHKRTQTDDEPGPEQSPGKSAGGKKHRSGSAGEKSADGAGHEDDDEDDDIETSDDRSSRSSRCEGSPGCQSPVEDPRSVEDPSHTPHRHLGQHQAAQLAAMPFQLQTSTSAAFAAAFAASRAGYHHAAFLGPVT